jgi:GTP cyclohydrolase I
MEDQIILSHAKVLQLTLDMSNRIGAKQPAGWDGQLKVYPVPRGGVPVAYLLKTVLPNIQILDNHWDADIVVDDIIDSGRTRDHHNIANGAPCFFALIDKTNPDCKYSKWVVFPWEKQTAEGHETVEHNITRLLQYVGEDPNREGLLETPARVAKAWKHWCSGYGVNPANVLKVFEDGADGYDQMIVRKGIIIHSFCEHHMAPIFGTCTVAYIPNGKIVGLSKIDRLVEIFARRLQVQERLTSQIADAIMEHLQPLGVGVYISARHLCIESRGVGRANSETVTTALRGCIKTEDSARAEFLALTRSY